jgi:transposase
MKQILKQVLGVDVAQKELVVTLGKMYDDLTLDLYAYKVFKNNKTGFAALLKWLKPSINKDIVCNGSNRCLSSKICLLFR